MLYYILVVLIFFGTRHEVGHDWFNYIGVYERLTKNPWKVDELEVGYKYLNVFSSYLGFGVPGVIMVSTLLLMVFTMWGAVSAGINSFYFFSAIAPYHFVMAGMNLTTQSIALGVSVLAFANLIRGRLVGFCLWVLFAALFHSSAILLLALAFIFLRKRYILLFGILAIVATLYISSTVYNQYLSTSMHNSGFYLRLGFIVVACLFILFNFSKVKKMGFRFYRLAVACIGFIPVSVVVSFVSTTMADRFSYYFIILSAMLVMMLGVNANVRFLSRWGGVGLFCTSMAAFTVWVIFSEYIPSYIYRSYLFM